MSASATTREWCCEMLAAAPRDELVELADHCLAAGPPLVIIHPPEVGMVMVTVREPVEGVRFHLGEVLVTRAEVDHRGSPGWAMCMGDDPVRALAAAILDAEMAAEGPFADAGQVLCRRTAGDLLARRRGEWAELAGTIVSFDEV